MKVSILKIVSMHPEKRLIFERAVDGQYYPPMFCTKELKELITAAQLERKCVKHLQKDLIKQPKKYQILLKNNFFFLFSFLGETGVRY